MGEGLVLPLIKLGTLTDEVICPRCIQIMSSASPQKSYLLFTFLNCRIGNISFLTNHSCFLVIFHNLYSFKMLKSMELKGYRAPLDTTFSASNTSANVLSVTASLQKRRNSLATFDNSGLFSAQISVLQRGELRVSGNREWLLVAVGVKHR